jgi:uncharacterized integral membrane protein
MPLRTLILGIVLVLIGLFAALNWSAFTAPTTLSLLFATVEAPLGLVMLGAIILLTVLFLVYLVYLQTAVLVDARRTARELSEQRALADQAEASRFTELRSALDERMQRLEAVVRENRSLATERNAELERSLRSSVEQGTNTLAAYIGELDDRVARRANPGSVATDT